MHNDNQGDQASMHGVSSNIPVHGVSSNIHVIVEDMARPLRLEFSGAQYHVTS